MIERQQMHRTTSQRRTSQPQPLGKRSRVTLLSTALSITVFLAGCSDSGNGNGVDEPGSNSGNGSNGQTGNTGNETRGLTGFETREDFERTLKDALLNHYGSQGGRDGGGSDQTTTTGAPVPVAAQEPQAAPDSGGGLANTTGDAGALQESSADSNFTDTNVQEAGVDEADRVKSDGRYLYVLGSQQNNDIGFPGAPLIDLPVITLETGVPVAGGDAIGFYQPTKARLRILELDKDSADSTLLHETTVELGGQSVDGMYLHGADKDALIMTSSSNGGGYWGHWGSPAFWGTTSSSIHRMNVSDRNNPRVVETANFDGQIISSRVVGDHMYVATRYFPQPEGINFDDPAVILDAAIDTIDVDAVMPVYTRSDGSSVPLANADNCFVSNLPEQGYYLPDIITLAAVNLNDLSLSDSVCYLGNVEMLYVSTEAAFLSSTFYDHSAVPESRPAVEPADGPVAAPVSEPVSELDSETEDDSDAEPGDAEPSEERPLPVDPDDAADTSVFAPRVTQARTDIHQFNFDGGQLAYTGSGSVDGYVSGSTQQRPFRFSHANGYLRVVTENDAGVFAFESGSVDASSPARSPVFVSVLKPNGAGKLDVVAKLPNDEQPAHIGKPGEQLYGSRFLGDKAYLVTFRQTDPLYVIDFSNPENPTVPGELVIEGYSDYLHPVGENHLLGLGRGAIPANDGFGDDRGAFATGIKVSLFDVSNPASPFEVQSLEIGQRGSNSEALLDHHGITYRQGENGGPGRLAFGIDVADIPTGDFGPAPFYNWRESGLHAFEVRTGEDAGVNFVGKMIVEAATPQNPWSPRSFGDRSLFVGDAVFYIHGDKVYGAQWGSLESYTGPK